jgi:hypothetical protein
VEREFAGETELLSPVPLCPPQIPHDVTWPGRVPGFWRELYAGTNQALVTRHLQAELQGACRLLAARIGSWATSVRLSIRVQKS